METAEKIIQWRRELHRHPEEGWTEFWTTGFVARQLADMGLAPRVGQEVIDPAARMGLPAPEVEARARQRALAEGLEPYWLERMGRTTGLVADVGPADAPLALVLRCDMDALPRHGHGTSRICVGRLEGGSSRNTVPASAFMACETRGNNSEVNDDMLRRARDVIAGAAAMHGLEWRLDVVGGAPSAASDAAFAELLARCARELPPDARGGGCFPLPQIREQGDMGASDDATTLMRAVQAEGGLAAYAFLGADLAAGHHQPGFDFDEAVLWPGVRWLEKICRELAG